MPGLWLVPPVVPAHADLPHLPHSLASAAVGSLPPSDSSGGFYHELLWLGGWIFEKYTVFNVPKSVQCAKKWSIVLKVPKLHLIKPNRMLSQEYRPLDFPAFRHELLLELSPFLPFFLPEAIICCSTIDLPTRYCCITTSQIFFCCSLIAIRGAFSLTRITCISRCSHAMPS